MQLSNLDILLKFSLANLVYSLANFAVKLLELRIFIEIFLGELSVIPLRTLRLNFWNLKYKLLKFPFSVFFSIENKEKPFQSTRLERVLFLKLIASVLLVNLMIRTKLLTYQRLKQLID